MKYVLERRLKVHKVAKGISKSYFPFDYNKNNPMQGFNNWALHIRNELSENLSGCELALLEAKKILIRVKS